MSLAATTLKATGALAVFCTVLAACTIWVVLSDPVTVATAVDAGDLSPIFGLLSRAFSDVFHSVVRYL
jgi:hypothetical protein